LVERYSDLRKPVISQVSILFSITIFLFLLIGYRAQYREFYSGILITEFGLIMLPALIYLIVFRYDLKGVLRLNKAKFLNFFVVFWLMAFAIPLSGLINFINLWIVNSVFGKVVVKQLPVAQNLQELLLNILIIGGTAGLCEEFLFRGVIQRGFERFGMVRAILGAAMLFSLTHLDFQKILGTFVLGSLIGFIVYRSDSLYCGMFAHFTNNSLAILISFTMTKLLELMKGTGFTAAQDTNLNSIFATFSAMPKEQLIIVVFIYGFMFLSFAAIFIALLFSFIKLNPSSAVDNPKRPAGAKAGLLWLIPGVTFIGMIYFAQVMNFRGVNSGFVEILRRLLGTL
jgi:membrane protease YdiL (CAAX protease family)